jgi:urease accessory protein
MPIVTIMATDHHGLLRLMTWLSPAFPVGAFSYSHGLEWAVHEGTVRSPDALHDWIADLIGHGSGWNDAVLLAESWHATDERDTNRLRAVCELGEALAPSSERRLETMQMGTAFLDGAKAWKDALPPGLDGSAPYSVAVGSVAARMNVELEETAIAFLHAFAANLVSAAIRLVPLGQSQGVAVLVRLESAILGIARQAARSSLDDLGSATIAADIASMRHETLSPRLFRS